MSAQSLRDLYVSCLHDDRLFDELFVRTSATVFHISRHYKMSTWDDDDIRQEARLVLYQMIHNFKANDIATDREFECLFYGYYQKSLMHHFLNHIRYERAQKRDVSKIVDLPYDEVFRDYTNTKVEETVIEKVTWDYHCRYSLNKEECLLLSDRLQGLSIRDCARKYRHGTRQTTQTLKKIYRYLQE